MSVPITCGTCGLRVAAIQAEHLCLAPEATAMRELEDKWRQQYAQTPFMQMNRYGAVVTTGWRHIWSIFTLQWPAIAWCALVGRE